MKKSLIGLCGTAFAVLLLFFSMPPFGFWLLAPLGFATMIWMQYRMMKPKFHWLVPTLFMSGYLTLMFMENYGFAYPQIVQFYPVIFVFLSVVGWLLNRQNYGKAINTNNRYISLQATLIWVAFDFIRLSLPMFGTGGFIGYSLYKYPYLIQPIGLFGMYGLDFVLVFFGCSLGMGFISLYDRRKTRPKELPDMGKPAKFWLRVSGSLLLIWLFASIILYFIPEKNTSVLVAALQPDSRDTTQLVEMTREAAVMAAKIVVWPEGAFINGNIKDDTKGKYVRDLAKELSIYLVVVNFIEGGYKGTRSEVVVIDPNGEVTGITGKDYPLRLLSESRSQKPTSKVYETEYGKIGTVISYDQLYLSTLRKAAKNGAGLILAPANEWAEQVKINLAYTIFRAVENKISIVKAETWYNTVFVNPKGKIVAVSQSEKGRSASIVVSNIPIGGANAFQIKYGDWFGWVCLIGVFLLPIIKKLF